MCIDIPNRNINPKCPKGLDQSEYEFTVRWKYYWKATVYTQIHFLHWKQFA